jgi:hypothetical protein
MAKHPKRGPAPIVGVMQQKIFGLPVDRDIIFSNHKEIYKKRVEKRQRGLIIRLPFLKPFLAGDEKILLVTTGHSPPTIFEKMGLGWLFVYLKRSLLVFTDRRIFHVPTTPIYRYRNSIAQILYGSCQSITLKGRALVITYSSQSVTDKFFSIAGREKKKIRDILTKVPIGGDGKTSTGRIHLCPQCAAPLFVSRSACQRCQLTFKSGTKATILAILLPGGGYLYIRQPFLGVVAAILEVLLLIGIGSSLSDMTNGVTSSATLFAGTSILFIITKLAAVVHTRVFIREFVPSPKVVTFQGLNAQTA